MRSVASLSLTLVLLILFLAAPPFSAEASWGPETRVSATPGRSGLSAGNAHCVALDSVGNVHVVWHDDTPGNYEIQYLTFDTLSVLPAESRNLTMNSGTSLDPSIAIVGDSTIFVVWTDDSESVLPSVLFARFLPSADTLLSYGRVSTGSSVCSRPCVAVSPDSSVHVVWSENLEDVSDVFYRKWDEGWVAAPLNISNKASSSVAASVATDGLGNAHVVWADNVEGNYEVFYRRYTSGIGWGGSSQISASATLAWSPSIGADREGNVYVVWSDRRDANFEIYFRRYLNATGWGNEKRVTYSFGISANPSVGVDCAGNVHIVWEDFREGNDEIYYRRISNSQGPGWDPVDTRLTDDSATSWNPSVAADSAGRVHVLWADGRDSNFEIYYKLGINPVPVDIELLSFYAECTVEGVLLKWDINSDSPTAFFDVFRRQQDGTVLTKLTEVSLLGKTEFLDTRVVNGVAYQYFLGIWQGELQEHDFFGPLSVEFVLPSAIALPAMRVWPNPSKGVLNIEFVAEGRGLPFRVSLLDVSGRMVEEIASGVASNRARSIPYDIASRLGSRLSPGVYFVSLEVGTRRFGKKVVILR